MANHGDISPEDFERLLQWLGPDRDLSTKKYVELHARLTRWFYFQGCRRPEDLADEVWNRIMKNLRDPRPEDLTDEEWNQIATKRPPTVSPDKDPVPLLFGYARWVLREYWSERVRFDEERDLEEGAAHVDGTALAELRAQCLELCLKRLDDSDAQLLREYHKYEPGRKIEHRKAMAEARQSTLNAIRLKISRLMYDLGNCVKGCCRSRGLEVQ